MGASRHGVDAALVADAIPHIVWTAGPGGETTSVNRRGTDYTGCPPDAVAGWCWVALVHPDEVEAARTEWQAAVDRGAGCTLEYRLRRYDGVYRWHAFRAQPVRDESGGVASWIGTATDIDDQKRLELSLRRAEKEATETLTLLQSVETSAPVAFKVVDRDLRIIRLNEMLARMNGLSVEEHLGRRVPETIPHLWPRLEAVHRRALAGEVITNFEIETPSAEEPGRMRHWLANYYPVYVDGEIVGVGNSIIDVTEVKEVQSIVGRTLAALVDTIATTLEHRDPYTAGHQHRVSQIAVAIATELGLDADTTEGIRTAASIHDLGKISIPAEILGKPGVLSRAEAELVREHAEAGYRIVAGIDFPWPVADMIRQHHERLDGSGYPLGLGGDEILVGARIIAVADVVEAMTAHRPYRPGRGVKAALHQIEIDRGTLLDPDAVDACLHLFRTGWLTAEVAMVDAGLSRRVRIRNPAGE